jgi:hypothetical protein
VEIAQLISEGKTEEEAKTSTNHSGKKMLLKWDEDSYFTLEK